MNPTQEQVIGDAIAETYEEIGKVVGLSEAAFGRADYKEATRILAEDLAEQIEHVTLLLEEDG